jgi:hypothetical protein
MKIERGKASQTSNLCVLVYAYKPVVDSSDAVIRKQSYANRDIDRRAPVIVTLLGAS